MTPEAIELGGIRGLRWPLGRRPVLALHGWLDNANSFVPMAEYLHDCDLVAIDFPGHGLSDSRPPGVHYHFDDYVFDILAALDALGWHSAHLLGHSLGGAVSTLAAAAAPDRVRTLALIEGLGPISAPADSTAAGWRKAVEKSTTRPRRIHGERSAAIAARVRGSDLTAESAGLLAERGLVEVEGGWQWRHDLRLTWPSAHRYTEPQVINLLSAIEAPVVNIHSDPPTGILVHRRYQLRLAALRNTRGKLACPGGHHLHMIHPQRIAPTIEEHFSNHDQ